MNDANDVISFTFGASGDDTELSDDGYDLGIQLSQLTFGYGELQNATLPFGVTDTLTLNDLSAANFLFEDNR